MVNQILIRPALLTDLDDVFAIHTRAIERAEERVLCAVVSDVVVGVAAMGSIRADPRTGSRSRRHGDPDAGISAGLAPAEPATCVCS